MEGEPNLELRVVTLNINEDYNRELMEQCKILREYAQYVAKVRNYTEKMKLDTAVECAVEECIQEGILEEFLWKNRAEVVAVSIFEYNKEEEEKKLREAEYEAGYLCGKMKIPFCANVQGLGTAFQKALLSNLVTVMYRTAFRKVETVFFENQANAQAFVRRRILPAKKEVVLSGAGINLEEYRYRQYPNNEKVHFLYLGRIMKEKGMDELFAAVEQLRKNGCEFVLDLVGFFEDEYKKQIEQLQSEGVVRFYGFQENPKPYYAQTDCVVLPSYHEGMSNVLLEAAASGRAIITTDIPGCREAVDNGKSGMLCKVKSTDSLYKAMKRFTELSREKRELLGKAGREKMEKKFNKKKVVEETVKVITKAMTKQERGMK